MSSKLLFGGLVAASVLSSTIALAHVSLPSGPAQADKSGTKITFGLSHGCEVGGVHYDTFKVRVEIPAGMTAVRPMFSDFGKPAVTRSGVDVTSIEWTKDANDVLGGDDGYYEVTIRAKIPNTPYARLPIVVHQICLVGGVEMTMSWDVLPPGTGNTAPVLTIQPARLNATGWNKFTIPAGVTVPNANLGTYFGDALIVWKGTEAFSVNANTVALIETTTGVTKLTGDLAAGDVIWVRY